MDASFTLSDWKQHYEGDDIDPTNVEYYNGGVVAPGSGGKFGDERLPAFWGINLRLEKVCQIGDVGTAALGIDAFNLSNSAHALKQQARITSASYGRDLSILNP